MLDHLQRASLIRIARAAVEGAVRRKETNISAPEETALLQPAGAFVTLRNRGDLRGCIGLVEPTSPLWEAVQRAGALAATQDFRFQSPRPDELPEIRLEISVLSPLEKVDDPSAIKVGTHGLVIESGMKRGLLLPQVAREWGWEREEFLQHTCEKAGLPLSAWREGAAIYCFTAQVFGEEDDDAQELYLHLKRAEALALLKQHLSTANLIKHCLAAEVVLKGLAQALGEDVPRWRLCGLLHDIDYDSTVKDMSRHTLVAEEILQRQGIDEEIIAAVKAHNNLAPRDTALAKALWAADPLTGMIVAAALISPGKKLAGIDAAFVLNRMKEKSFARGANREQMASCQELGLSLEQFITIGLNEMQKIAPQLGL